MGDAIEGLGQRIEQGFKNLEVAFDFKLDKIGRSISYDLSGIDSSIKAQTTKIGSQTKKIDNLEDQVKKLEDKHK